MFESLKLSNFYPWDERRDDANVIMISDSNLIGSSFAFDMMILKYLKQDYRICLCSVNHPRDHYSVLLRKQVFDMPKSL